MQLDLEEYISPTSHQKNQENVEWYRK